jgi:N-methylhydantoinase A/oxoprolinase/acetone carboxylase beta subunit
MHPHAGVRAAAGVIGTKALCDGIGLKNAIAFDMGGTTAKAGSSMTAAC